MRALAAGLLVLVLGGTSYAKPPQSHPETRLCVVGDDRGFDTVGYRENEIGHVEVGFDRNGDGKVDYVEFYEKIGADRLRPFPFKLVVSAYFDNRADKIVIDIAGDGRCEDLRQIDAHQPELRVSQ
jgi:hypothetical protein